MTTGATENSLHSPSTMVYTTSITLHALYFQQVLTMGRLQTASDCDLNRTDCANVRIDQLTGHTVIRQNMCPFIISDVTRVVVMVLPVLGTSMLVNSPIKSASKFLQRGEKR